MCLSKKIISLSLFIHWLMHENKELPWNIYQQYFLNMMHVRKMKTSGSQAQKLRMPFEAKSKLWVTNKFKAHTLIKLTPATLF